MVSADPVNRLLLRAEVRHGGERFVAHTVEISTTAIVLACDSFAIGAEAEIRLSFPGLVEPFDLTVRVGRSAARHGHSLPAVAICEISSIDAKGARHAHAGPDLAGEPRRRSVGRGRNALPTPSLVEDNGFIRDLFGYGLDRYSRSRGAQIMLEVANDAEAAWEISPRASATTCAIVDHYLPLLTGAELHPERMRAEERVAHMLVVAISVGGREARDAAMAAGADIVPRQAGRAEDLFSTLDRLTRKKTRGMIPGQDRRPSWFWTTA